MSTFWCATAPDLTWVLVLPLMMSVLPEMRKREVVVSD
jgi:hypothetical protein